MRTKIFKSGNDSKRGSHYYISLSVNFFWFDSAQSICVVIMMYCYTKPMSFSDTFKCYSTLSRYDVEMDKKNLNLQCRLIVLSVTYFVKLWCRNGI